MFYKTAEPPAALIGNPQDFLVGMFIYSKPGRHIGSAGQAEHFHPQIIGDDRLIIS